MRAMATHFNPAVRDLPPLTRKQYLAAIASHDAEMDSAFVYAVRSTRIYCRPSCPSRRPRENHILFFSKPDEAEQAGFRACRRCHPREIGDNRKAQMVGKVCKEIENNPDKLPSLKNLAELTGLSPAHLQRTFREAMGITPRQYADALRVTRFKSELRKGSDVTTALHEVSYGSASRLYEKSDSQLGMTPAIYRKGGQGMNISYTIADSSMGRVLVAGTERGISAVYLGDKDSDLSTALREEYPKAEIRPIAEGKSKWVRAIIAHLDKSNSPLNLPTDVMGTAFQRRVWQALREIPLGATRTYSDVARAIGQPTAIRAVGHACATNPASIVVPCHRVIRTDGTLGGYRWGLHRKKSLLEKERRAAKAK
jgi:AraC family transcriptional regulator, regulatory protein of adaptative response / methylated-DNA-[protein]-cysteine methyltransferase